MSDFSELNDNQARMLTDTRQLHDPVKKRRDAAQGLLIEGLVRNYLPQWHYDEQVLQGVPKQLRALVQKA